MNKILISSLAVIAIFSGCATKTTQEVAKEQTAPVAPAKEQPAKPVVAPKQKAPSTPPAAHVIEVQTIDFNGVDDTSYKATLISHDHFETAVLSDTKGNKVKLKNAPAGSGVRMVSENGIEIHFKGGNGVVNLGKGKKDIFVQYKVK